jgi:hypothetical protein
VVTILPYDAKRHKGDVREVLVKHGWGSNTLVVNWLN